MGHTPPLGNDTRTLDPSSQTSDSCPLDKGIHRKQEGFFVHRQLPSGSTLPEREAENKATRGGSWEQGSVVSAPRVAACSPPEVSGRAGR